MNKADRKELYKCNKKDLINLINSNDPKNKFSKVVSYIARQEMYGGETKDDLYDLIYTARNEFIALDAKTHMDDGFKRSYDKLHNVDKREQERVIEFIRNPVGAMTRELANLAKTQNDPNEVDEDVIVYSNRLRTNSTMLVTQIGIDASTRAPGFNKYDERTDIVNRINKKIPNDASIDKALDRINGGTFGKLFRRPSKEYKAFEESFNMFRDHTKANSGDTQDLQKNTNAYLSHLIPDYDPNKIGEKKQEWLNHLSGGQKKRAEFAMGVIDSVKEHNAAKPFMDNVNNGIQGRKINESIEANKIDLKAKDQLDFQNGLSNNIKYDAVKNNKVAKDNKVEAVKEKENKEVKAEAPEEDLEPII